MDTVLIEFTTVNKSGTERFLLPLRETCLLGENKKGCCVMVNDGCVYDVVNAYDDVKKTLAEAGIKIVSLPVPVE
ncbi:MAG: hypothetical protein NC350_03535 [Corallococcus sp.]|nr:hypothetical protein [Corallococcus sp.]